MALQHQMTVLVHIYIGILPMRVTHVSGLCKKKHPLTTPRLRVDHGNINVVEFQHCTKLQTNVSSPNNHSFPILLCFDCLVQFVSVVNLSQIKDVFRISSFHTKICQPYNLANINISTRRTRTMQHLYYLLASLLLSQLQ